MPKSTSNSNKQQPKQRLFHLIGMGVLLSLLTSMITCRHILMPLFRSNSISQSNYNKFNHTLFLPNNEQEQEQGANKEAAAAAADSHDYDNIIMIVLDQLRYDAVGYVQARLQRYDDWVHIRTPHIDALAQQGVVFSTTYSQSVSCAPSRATLKTGYTVARHGIAGNRFLTRKKAYQNYEAVQFRIESLITLEETLHNHNNNKNDPRHHHNQSMTQKHGSPSSSSSSFSSSYHIETFGKWHFPVVHYGPIAYNLYHYHPDAHFDFAPQETFRNAYQRALQELSPLRNTRPIQDGDQISELSAHRYTPVYGDPRHALPTNTSEADLPPAQQGMSLGIDALSGNYTATAILADMGLRALDRLVKQQEQEQDQQQPPQPFMLSFHFNAPHPPRIASAEYIEYYRSHKDQLWQTLSLHQEFKAKEKMGKYGNNNIDSNQTNLETANHETWPPPLNFNVTHMVAEMTAVYYAMVEEVDTQIGRIMAKLQAHPAVANRTLIVFTGDHGELLGSHGGMTGKNNFYEESVRVPMIFVHPTKIQSGTQVNTPVSHLDVVTTVLDYAGVPKEVDQSDGTSLRRFIEQSSFNEEYDEEVAVSEHDQRIPDSDTSFSPPFSGYRDPSFMVRRGPYKLLISRYAQAKKLADAMFDLSTDPYEMHDVLKTMNKSTFDTNVIGTAEHLRALLLEWMKRHDGAHHYFSSSRWNGGVGLGDIREVAARQSWKRLPMWQSTQQLQLGVPVYVAHESTLSSKPVYRRVEYVYMGGSRLRISAVKIEGADASSFSSVGIHHVKECNYYRIRVSFRSHSRPQLPVQEHTTLNATLVVWNNVNAVEYIPIVYEQAVNNV